MTESNEAQEVTEQVSDEQLDEVAGGIIPLATVADLAAQTAAASLNLGGNVALNPEPVEIGSPVGQGLVAGGG